MKFKLRVPAVEASRCRLHRDAYRRFYKSQWKARKAGSPSAEQPYVPEPVYVEQIAVTPEVVEILAAISRDLDFVTRKLSQDLQHYRGDNIKHVRDARAKAASSSEQLSTLVDVMRGAKRYVAVTRGKGARRAPGTS
ncbi:hypothetical protein [Cellulomonas soli]|uniref:Uncharacterized protein n=1 Tax=Cellulomonas soli TaxID=931535 RepID=A0A512PIB7_9CELL|nr:hypothetical protein [Cellulomonas soli]NYI58664.1 hypothetical protein [Cellulomonas soli]GEP70950.1 hypothetical protein CSO01_36650 [Cellulomonas soli]